MNADRPAVDVVMPFAGAQAELAAARARLGRIQLGPHDTATLADNRAGGDAGTRPGSYFARNAGAARGSNPWLVFVDADVEPATELLDAYFEPAPGEKAGVLVGAVRDEVPGEKAGIAAEWAHEVGLMSQSRTLERGEWAYAQTANCAVRRAAFEAVGGFREDVRSGGDADLCFRVRAAGWTIEERPAAAVVHRSRVTVKALLRQRARVGAGARWLDERHPGFASSRPLPRAAAGTVRELGRAVWLIARGRRRSGQLKAVSAVAELAFHVGWRLPNRPRYRR